MALIPKKLKSWADLKKTEYEIVMRKILILPIIIGGMFVSIGFGSIYFSIKVSEMIKSLDFLSSKKSSAYLEIQKNLFDIELKTISLEVESTIEARTQIIYDLQADIKRINSKLKFGKTQNEIRFTSEDFFELWLPEWQTFLNNFNNEIVASDKGKFHSEILLKQIHILSATFTSINEFVQNDYLLITSRYDRMTSLAVKIISLVVFIGIGISIYSSRSSYRSVKDIISVIFRSKQYTENILSSLSEALFIFNAAGQLIYVNNMALKLMGCTFTDLNLKHYSEIIRFEAAENALKDMFNRVKASGEEISNVYFNNLTAELISYGKVKIPVLSNGSLTKNHETGESEIILTTSDSRDSILVTELQLAKNKLIQNQNELEMLVAERTKELSLAHENLLVSEKMAAVGEMTGQIAHEMNTPLNAVVLTVDGLIENIEEASSLDVIYLKSQLVRVKSVSLKLSKIISTMRKMASGENAEVHESAHVNDMIRDTILLCEARINNSGITFKSVSEISDEQKIICSATQVGQVIINIINNSVDALKELATKEIKLTTKLERGFVMIIIEDSGSGIPTEIAKRIFEPKYTTKTLANGTGLGLYISKNIIEKGHGGQLYLDVTKPKTTFVIKLPI